MARAVTALKGGGRNKSLLYVSLLFGIVSALLVYTVLKSADDGQPVQVSLVPVVVAAHDIPARTKLTAEMLEVREVPVDQRGFDAYSDIFAVEGLVAADRVQAGSQIVRSALVLSAEDLGLSYAIPPGMRAVAIESSEAIATGGLIQPGDYVDVVGVIFPDRNDVEMTQAVAIAQNVLVLAVAQTTRTAQEVDPESDFNKIALDPESITTVTLAVSLEQAQAIAAIEQAGEIRLALRGFGDDAIVEDQGVRLIEHYLETMRFDLVQLLEGLGITTATEATADTAPVTP